MTEVKQTFVAVVYRGRTRADEALTTLLQLDGLKDAALVELGTDGRAQVLETHDVTAPEGVVAGGTIGLVIGSLIGGPIVGAIVGMTGGGGVAARDSGLPDARLSRVGERLSPEHTAVCLLLEGDDLRSLRTEARRYGGRIVVAEPLVGPR
jgi:uncharacterized membrane protein